VKDILVTLFNGVRGCLVDAAGFERVSICNQLVTDLKHSLRSPSTFL
jgi:hypothetical protein